MGAATGVLLVFCGDAITRSSVEGEQADVARDRDSFSVGNTDLAVLAPIRTASV